MVPRNSSTVRSVLRGQSRGKAPKQELRNDRHFAAEQISFRDANTAAVSARSVAGRSTPTPPRCPNGQAMRSSGDGASIRTGATPLSASRKSCHGVIVPERVFLL